MFLAWNILCLIWQKCLLMCSVVVVVVVVTPLKEAGGLNHYLNIKYPTKPL
jgi:hypothetical protein